MGFDIDIHLNLPDTTDSLEFVQQLCKFTFKYNDFDTIDSKPIILYMRKEYLK